MNSRSRHPSRGAPGAPAARGAPGATLPHAVERDLVSMLGADGVITDPDALLVYETDALPAHRATPRAVLLPPTTDSLAAAIRRLATADIPFTPRGAGTGLSGGAIALHDAVVVSTARLNRILELDPANRVARVEAGVVNARLNAAARLHGLRYAPDPSSEPVCTIGGNVAENSGGPHCLKYGVTLNHVLGLTVALPDGEIVRLGEKQTGGGYDLVGLFVGSEGTLGIATEIEVRLTPLPDSVETLLALFDDVHDASRSVSAIIAAGLLPAALEMVDRQGILAVEGSPYRAGTPTDVEGALVIEFDGPAAGPEEDAARAREICLANGAREVRRAADDAERDRLWHARKKAYGAMGRLAPDLLVQDGTVPRSRLPETLARIYEIAARHGLRISNTFHAGDGNLHPKILFDRRKPRVVEVVERASKEMMTACVDAGGTITGEHGVGLDKRSYMGLIYGAEELAAMAAVRQVFDPRGMANPGKVLPDDDSVMPAETVRQESPVGRAEASRATAGGDRTDAAKSPAGQAKGQLIERLRSVLGAEAVHSVAEEQAPAPGLAPKAIITPADTEQAAAALRVCSERGWTVLPAGGATWLQSVRPCRADVLLSARRMAGITEYEPADLAIAVRAGTTLDDLDAGAREHNQFFPVEAPAVPGATVGGAIATASAGPLRLGYGTPRDHVLGLQVVTGDGRLLELGGRVVKNVAGYDLIRLMVGSRGSLGLITRATLRLRSRPATDLTAIVQADDPRPLYEAAMAVMDTWPVAAELLAPPTARRVLEGNGTSAGSVGEAGWVLALRWHGNASFADHVAKRLPECGGLQMVPPEHAIRFWRTLSDLESKQDTAFHLAARPLDLPSLVDTATGLTDYHLDRSRNNAGRASGPVWHIAAHAGSGIVRVWTANVDPDSGESPWGGSGKVRQDLEGHGAVHAVVPPPGAAEVPDGWLGRGERKGAGARTDRVRELVLGIRTVFDPDGVLAGPAVETPA